MVQLLLDAGALLGESPFWHAAEARLYWVDIAGRALLRANPEFRGLLDALGGKPAN